MITIEEFENFIHSNLVYEQKIIYIIDDKRRQIPINNLSELYNYRLCTIKLEQMEKYNIPIFEYCTLLSNKYNHKGPVTCHLFRSFNQSKSFGLHFDPDDVIIYCISGEKKIFVLDKEYILLPNETLFIPANTPHQAINEKDSLTLSFGLEKFYKEKLKNELDVLSENN